MGMGKGDHPLVSIIVPVYNTEKYLQKCILSLLDQEYPNIEILLIDDGSTDSSGKICDQFKLNAKVTVIHQNNTGVSATRNEGLRLARGEYLAFVDSDDYVHPKFITAPLEKILKDEADIVLFDYYNCKKRSITESEPINLGYYGLDSNKTENGIKKLLLTDCLPSFVWNKFYKRELWNDIYFLNGHTYEDVYAMTRILQNVNKISYLGQNLYYYNRDDDDSISNSFASLNSINRYFHFDALKERKALVKEKVSNIGLKELYFGRLFREGVATIITDMGNPQLSQSQLDSVIQFVRKYRKAYAKYAGSKTQIMAWCIIYFKLLSKYYAKLKYNKKIGELRKRRV